MAKGSHATRGDYPTHCHICGKPVRVTKDNAQYHTNQTGEQLSFHIPCRTRLGITEAQLWGKP